MKFAVDLHVHTALSPCGDDDMTPNNIVNMAMLKGLDIIAITDHNTCANLQAVIDAGRNKGLMVIPGIEVQSKEEVHLICLFKKLEKALEFGEFIYNSLPNIPNNEELFGKQLIIDASDNITGKLEKLLLSSSTYSINEIFELVNKYDGLCIPAHIDRSGYSIISNLGFIPPNLNVNAVEISKKLTLESALEKMPYIKCYNHIISSDAHYLWDINEREYFVEMEYISSSQLFEALQAKLK
jgi:3',5'-nucleoside bisphosphate phosphatase